jgi:hypothetical protein
MCSRCRRCLIKVEDFKKGQEEIAQYPNGVISIASGFLGRYREFDVSLHHLLVPPGTHIQWGLGVYIAYSFNEGIREMLKTDAQWVWFLGDDHTFSPDLLLVLLRHNVDFVAPLVLRRSIPFRTVLCDSKEKGFGSINIEDVQDWKGLVDISDKCIGNAGLLVKRNVFESMPGPWYENGQTNPEYGGSDLWLCEKVRKAGFKMYCDSDQSMGHVNHCFFWIERNSETGLLQPDIRMVDGY